MLGAGELIVSQSQAGIALHRVGPNRNSFIAAPELPKRFPFFLARENQVVSFRQRFIQTCSRFFITAHTIQDRAAIIKTQSFALAFLISRSMAKQLDGLVRVAQKIFKPRQLRHCLAVYKQPEVRGSLKMLFSRKDVLAVRRTKPAGGICLRKRKLVGHVNFLESEVARKLLIADPAGVRIQSNPDESETSERPASLSDFVRRLQIEAVKGQFFGTKQSPQFQGEKCGDRRITERHEKWDHRVNTANSQETSQKYQRADDFFGPRHRITSSDGVRLWSQDRRLPKTEIEGIIWTNADAIHTLHATRIDYHPVLLHLSVHQHV